MKLAKEIRTSHISPEEYMISRREKEEEGGGILALSISNSLISEQKPVDGSSKQWNM